MQHTNVTCFNNMNLAYKHQYEDIYRLLEPSGLEYSYCLRAGINVIPWSYKLNAMIIVIMRLLIAVNVISFKNCFSSKYFNGE